MDNQENIHSLEKPSSVNWGAVISNVGNHLPSVESDSEVRSISEESDDEQLIFQRPETIFCQDMSSNNVTNEKKEVIDSRTLLFQRLKCQATSRIPPNTDGELPIYEDISRSHDSFTEEDILSSGEEKAAFYLHKSVFGAPKLSLQTLDEFDLDDVLGNFSVSLPVEPQNVEEEKSSEIHCKPEVLMSHLVNLSSKQLDEKRIVETDVSEKSPCISTKQNELGNQNKHTNRVYKTELTCSEPTTIYLDLRSQLQDQKTKENEKKQPIRISSKGTSTVNTHTSSLLNSNLNENNLLSDDSEDDFEQWRDMRNRFKEKAFCSVNKVSQKNVLEASPQVAVSKARKLIESTPSSCMMPKSVKVSKRYLNDVESKDSKDELVRVTMQKVKELKSLHQHNSAIAGHTGLQNGEVTASPTKHTKCGHKEETCIPNGMYASQRLKNPGISDSAKPVPLGKSTVLFAEEPQTDSLDTTNIFRNKKLKSLKPVANQATTTSVQTDESFSTSYNVEDKKKYAIDSIMTSTTNAAAPNKVEKQKKDEGDIVTVRQTLCNGSRHDIVQNQRKQLPFHEQTYLGSKYVDSIPTVPFESRARFSALLNNIHKEKKDENERKMFPYLYDREATFSNELDSIPNSVNATSVQKMVLLTFHMVSPGVIVFNRTTPGHRFNPVDPPNNLSLTYSLLFSWLLALVPDRLEKPHDPPREDVFTLDCDTDHESDSDIQNGHDDLIPSIIEVPFNVISLHQVWQEESQTIVTNAVVIPNFFYKPDISGRRKKPKKENAFFQVVWHFLQSNRVQDVCPWYSRPESPIYTLNEISLACSTKPLSTYISISNDSKLLHKSLSKRPGFFWNYSTPEEYLPSCPSELNLETTICLLQKESFSYPLCLMDFVVRLQLSCLDVVGLRLTYVTKKFVQKNILHNGGENLEEVVPCAAIAIRGKSAIKKVQNIIGPRDPLLARMTDHGSLNAVYGEQLSKRRGDKEVPTEMHVFHCPRGKDRVMQQLSVWFGGRVSPNNDILLSCIEFNGNMNLNTKIKSVSKSKGKGRNVSVTKTTAKCDAVAQLSSNSYLTTWKATSICLVISSRFPPQFIGDIIAITTDQGFCINGIKRMHLNERKVAGLCIPTRYVTYFNPHSSVDDSMSGEYYEIDNWWQRPVTILLLSRENASAHQCGLIASIQSELIYRLVSSTEQGHLHSITYQCFHVCPYNDTVSHAIGPMCKFPDMEAISGSTPRCFYSDPELEQVVVLALIGNSMIDECGCILQTLLHGEFYIQPDEYNASHLMCEDAECSELNSEFRGFELLGIKYVQAVSSRLAKELTPFEVGTELWYKSIPLIKDGPALLCVLRRINAFNIIRSVLKIPHHQDATKNSIYFENLDRIMSPTPEVAYLQIKTCFCEKELFADNRCRPLLKYLPPPMRVAQYMNGYFSKSDEGDGNFDKTQSCTKSSKKRKKRKQKSLQNQSSPVEESILDAMLCQPHPITSVLIIKPDAFPRHVVKILRRLYQENFSLVAINMSILSEDQASQIMPSKYNKMLGERSVFISHMTSAASLIICTQRINAVRRLLDVAGPTDPQTAFKQYTVGGANWRAEFGIDEFSNAIHVSEGYVAACEELKLFFPEGLCCKQTFELKMEQVPSLEEYSAMKEEKVKGRQVKVSDDPLVDLLGATGMEIQPVCIILTEQVISILENTRPDGIRRTYPPYIDILEQLLTQGFEICAWRMANFSKNQASLIHELLGDRSCNIQYTINILTSGPSMILILQRENGLILFDSILGSCLRRYGLVNHAQHILRTNNLKQTHLCIKHFFNQTANKRSVVQIYHKRALEWKDCNGLASPML